MEGHYIASFCGFAPVENPQITVLVMIDDPTRMLRNGAFVGAVARRNGHGLGKTVVPSIRLVAGEGVEGDAHRGTTVKHRSRVARDPDAPNLRQVHIVHAELLEEVAVKGFVVAPGELGENILTRGLALLDLPERTRLVANAVTIETEMLEIALQRERGGRLMRFDIAEAQPLGRMLGWVPARPVVQWSVTL